MTKTRLLEQIAENTGLPKKDLAAVLDELGVAIERHIKKGAVGTFALPGLLKIKTVKKPARKAQKGVANPFRPGETHECRGQTCQYAGQSATIEKIEGYGQVIIRSSPILSIPTGLGPWGFLCYGARPKEQPPPFLEHLIPLSRASWRAIFQDTGRPGRIFGTAIDPAWLKNAFEVAGTGRWGRVRS